MNKALDEVRAGEARRMATESRVPVLRMGSSSNAKRI